MARMKKKYKLFIVIGVLLNVLLCGGLYLNYKLDRLVASLNAPGVLFVDAEAPPLPDDGDAGEAASPSVVVHNGGTAKPVGQGSTYYDPSANQGGASPREISDNSPTAPVEPPDNTQIVGSVAQKVDKPLDKTDLIKAGFIILRKLNSEEIAFLYRVGNNSEVTREELVKTREMLLSKLSPEDIATLRQLGDKYGKELRILDPSVPIR